MNVESESMKAQCVWSQGARAKAKSSLPYEKELKRVLERFLAKMGVVSSAAYRKLLVACCDSAPANYFGYLKGHRLFADGWSERRTRIQACQIVLLLISTLTGVLTSEAIAQESGLTWKLDTTGSSYPTQDAALAALKSKGGKYSKLREIEATKIDEDRVEVIYSPGKDPSVPQPWQYSQISGSPPIYASEEPVIADILEYWNAKSRQDGCSPNTQVVSRRGYLAIVSWGDGLSQAEIDSLQISYRIQGDFGCISNDRNNSYITRVRPGRCDDAQREWQYETNSCIYPGFNASLYSYPLACHECSLAGDPTDVTTGDQYETEADITTLSWISLERYYHSATSNGTGNLGPGWTHSQAFRLAIGTGSSPSIGYIRPNGSQLPFKLLSTGVYEATDGSGMRVVADSANWRLYEAGEVITFNAKGQPIIRNFEDGTTLSYVFDPVGRLASITHSSGRVVVFNYANGASDAPLSNVNLAGFALVTYGYVNGRLSSATYADNTVRTYVYEDTRFPQHLTGIVAEDNRRLATFAYDVKGRSICSVQGGSTTCNATAPGFNKSLLSYTATGGAVVTDALGRVSTYGLTPDEGGKPRQVSGVTDSTAGSGQLYHDYSADFRRRLDTTTDRRGFQTKHTYGEGTDTVTSAPISIHTAQEAVGQTETRTTEERRDLTSNRLLVSKIGNLETRVTRNARLQPTSVTAKDLALNLVRTTTYTYCEAADVSASNSTCPILGLLKSVDGPRTSVNDVTTYTYYPSDDPACSPNGPCPHRKGDLWKVTNGLNQVAEILKYGGAGRILSVKDANGVVTDTEFSPRGWLTARKVRGTNNSSETDDHILRVDYWLTGKVKQITQPNGSFASFIYDSAQRLTDVSDNAGNKIHYLLDDAGNRLQEETKDPSGVLTKTLSRIYDTLGQLKTQADGQNNPTDFTYDNSGNPDKTTDALLRKSDQNYDALNRLSRILQNEGASQTAETQFKYDVYDNLKQVTDPKLKDTNYDYNAFGNLLTLESPDTGTTTYGYDLGGNRTSQLDAKNVTTTYSYDAINRLTAVVYPTSALNVAYSYDTFVPSTACPTGETFVTGRLAKMTDGSGSTQYCYDRFGMLVRKIQVTNGKTFVVRYEYDAAGNLLALTYPNGQRVAYTRNAQSQIQGVGIVQPGSDCTEVLLRQVTYAPFGPAISLSFGDGSGGSASRGQSVGGSQNDSLCYSAATVSREFVRSVDFDYLPKSVQDPGPGGLSLGYHFDAVDRLDQISDAATSNNTPVVRYGYDPLDRLQSTKYGTNNTIIDEYSYDATGNRLSYKNGVTTSYTYPTSNHRLTSVGATARGYSNTGNTTSIGGTAREFTYNDLDRMSSVKQNGVVKMNYVYNGKGEQVRRYIGTVNTYTVFDEAGHWLGDYDNNGVPTQQAVWMDDLPVGLMTNAGKTYYVEADHLGTPRAVIDPARDVAVWTWNIKSEPFGDSLPQRDPDGDNTFFEFNMRFPGQRFDAASGLNQNYFREYDPTIGRYVQSDPIGLGGGASTYAYGGGRPVSSIDPLGLQFSPALPVGPLPIYIPPVATPGTPENKAWTQSAEQLIDSLSDSLQKENCNESDRCREILAKIRMHVKGMEEVYNDLLQDEHRLYLYAYDVNPGGPLSFFGTYRGHILRYEGYRVGLRRMIDEARQEGCLVPPEAIQWLSRPAPNRPSVGPHGSSE